MKRHVESRCRFVAWAGILLVAVAVTASTADTPIWSVRGCSVSGNTVGATLTNVGHQVFSGFVQVQAVIDDTPIWSSAPVSAKPGQSVLVPVPFPGKVQSVLSVGVTDSPTPF